MIGSSPAIGAPAESTPPDRVLARDVTSRAMEGTESFLVLHGLGNHRPPEHWQFWISAQLAAAGNEAA